MGEITFRRVTRADFRLLATWLAEPHVSRWWNHEFDDESVERDFGSSADGDEPGEDHLALLDGRPFGLIQYSWYRDYPEYRDELRPIIDVPDDAASIDYLIGDPALIGRGLGAEMLAAFVDGVWRSEPSPGCIIVPVNSANEVSWRALGRVGFERCGRGELEPDNPIDDRSHEIYRLERPGPAARSGVRDLAGPRLDTLK